MNVPEAYLTAFTSVRNDFLLRTDIDLEEKLMLIWLASKPPDWVVVQDVAEAELGIGPYRAKKILRSLRDKGLITKEPVVQQSDGTWRRPPGRLANRESIRHVSPGRTEGRIPTLGVTCANALARVTGESLPRSDRRSKTERSVNDLPIKEIEETSVSESHEQTVPEVDDATGLIRATCSCGKTGPWREPHEQLQITADYRQHASAFTETEAA